MPEYTVQDTTTGRTITFDWQDPNPPTDADLEAVFAEARSAKPHRRTDSDQARRAVLEELKGKTPGRDYPMEGVETPWVDPISAAAGGFGATATTALRAGSKVLPAIGRSLLSSGIGAAADVPIGTATEVVEEKSPHMALPFSILVGTLSGATLESAIQRKILGVFSRGGVKVPQETVDVVTAEVKKALSAWDTERAESILKLAQDSVVPSAPVMTTAQRKVTAPLTELAQEAVTPPKPKFMRTAEDLLQEEVDKGALVTGELPKTPVPGGQKVQPPPAESPSEILIPGKLDEESTRSTLDLARIYAKSDPEAEAIGKYADSINLERIDTPDDVKRFISDTSKAIAPAIHEARRGTISHQELTRMAMRSGITEEKMILRKTGQAWNAEEGLAASMINTTSAKRTLDLARKAAAGGSDQDLLEFRLAMERHRVIQAAEAGSATEAGRALSARRILKTAEQLPVKNLRAMIDAVGGREITKEIAQRLSKIDPENTTAVNRFIREAGKAKTQDKVFEVWVNALLSSPITHAVNSTSNTLTYLSKFPEKATAAGVDFLRSAFTGRPRTRYMGEVAADAFAGTQGIKAGVKNAWWSFVNEMPTDAQAKLEVKHFQAIKGPAGKYIRIPGRLLMAADEFFKALNYTTELHGQAFRKAMREGLTGQAKARRIAEIIQNPTEEITEAARGEMLYRVFQKDLSPEMKRFLSLRSSDKFPWAGLRYLIPFVRTPVNIAKYGLERTPLAFLDIARRQLGKEPLEAGELADRIGRAFMGTAIGAVVYQAANEGMIIGGGPKDRTRREALYRTGWQPYSVKVGDKYYSYGRLEPLGTVLGLAADLSEGITEMTDERKKSLVGRTIRSISTNLTSKTFLSGVSDFLAAVNDSDRYAQAWVEGFGGTVIPRVMATGARATDPYFRETQEGMGEYIQSQVPYLSQDLLPKRNIWGEPIERTGTPGQRFLSPVQVSQDKGMESDREIARLDVRLGHPSRKIKDIELTPTQYDELLVAGGQRAKKAISNFINSSQYRRLTDEARKREIERRYDGAMKLEKSMLHFRIRKEAAR